MKKLLTLFFLSLCLSVQAQTRDSIVITPRTVTEEVCYDTTYTTWDTTIIKVPISVEYHSLYVNYEDVLTWMANPHKYLSWVKKQGFNQLLMYARSLLVSSSNRAKIAGFVKIAKEQYGIFNVFIDVRSDGRFDEFGNLNKYFAEYPAQVYKLNAVTEREPYVTGDYAGFWPFLREWNKYCKAKQMIFACYMGQPTQQGWDSIVFYCDKIYLSKYITMSTYNAGRSYNYVATRWTRIASANKRLKPLNIVPCEYITSLERIAWGDGNDFQGLLFINNDFFGSVWQQDINDYKTKSTAEVLQYTRLEGLCHFSSRNAQKCKPVN